MTFRPTMDRAEATVSAKPTTGPVRGILGVAAALLMLAAVAFASLFAGSGETTIAEAWAVVTGHGSGFAEMVVTERAPRTLSGVVVGGALAVSGVIIQGITRNPLGDPGYLGVTTGASAAVVTAAAFAGIGVGTATVWIALPGGVIAVLVVYLLGSRAGSDSVVPLILAGAVVTAVLHAYINAVVLSLPQVFDSFRFWVVGSLTGVVFSDLTAALPAFALGAIVAAILASGLNALALGDEVATSLGAKVTLVRAAGILAATLLAAAATAVAGPIAFVGLAVPHVVRSIVGTDFRWQIPAAALGGGIMLLVADILARIIVRPQELMVGIVTAFVGAPFLLAAIRRTRVMRT